MVMNKVFGSLAILLVVAVSAAKAEEAEFKDKSPNHEYTISGSVLGLWPVVQFGPELGYQVAEGSYVELAYNWRSNFDSSVTTSSSLARWRYFWGGSFYSTLGLGYMVSEWREDFGGASADAHVVRLTEESVFAEISAGNQWDIGRRMFLACDWLSVGVPLMRTSGPSNADGSGSSGNWYTEGMEEAKGKKPRSQFSIARMRVGWKF